MGGVDFRLSKVFGIGPFVDFSVAQFSRFDNGINGTADIRNKALHEWLTFGAKLTFFP